MPVLPMFPLGSVLLPGMVLPLHVFEERYRRLVRDCLAGDREFGVALIERGSEVGGGDIRAMAGTVARIVDAEEQPDGRWGIVAVGARRIRVREWLPDDPYPRAEVEDWPDAESADVRSARVKVAELAEALGRVLSLAHELGAQVPSLDALSTEPLEASYQVAILSPIGPLDRQKVLTSESFDDRCALLAELLADQELMIRARLDDR